MNTDTETLKAKVFELLTAAGVQSITVPFHGYGDEGWVDAPTDESQINEIVLPKETADALENFCYAALREKSPGWEINDGSQGHFTFDVPSGKVKLELGQNRTVTDEETFDL